MELPSHRESEDTCADQEPAATAGWGGRLVVAVAVALFAVVVILHLTGVVGPGAQ